MVRRRRSYSPNLLARDIPLGVPRHGGCHACCLFGVEYGHVASRRGILAWRRMEVAYGFSPSAFSVLSVGKVHTCARLLLGYNIQIRTDSLSLSLSLSNR